MKKTKKSDLGLSVFSAHIFKAKSLKRASKTKRLEPKGLVSRAGSFVHNQLAIRPRLRLFSKVFLLLVLLLVISAQASDILASRKEQFVVNGRKILVAQQKPVIEDVVNNVDQKIEPAKSPFEFSRPVNGYISQGFSFYHNAIDIATDLGTPVHPLGRGVVKYAGFMNDGHGLTVVLEHENGLSSLYAHLGRVYVGVGNEVNPQSPLGSVGLTGRTTGPHVHLEMTDNGKFVDPAALLPGN